MAPLPMTVAAAPIRLKVVPSKLYANWFTVPGLAEKDVVPARVAVIPDTETDWPAPALIVN